MVFPVFIGEYRDIKFSMLADHSKSQLWMSNHPWKGRSWSHDKFEVLWSLSYLWNGSG